MNLKIKSVLFWLLSIFSSPSYGMLASLDVEQNNIVPVSPKCTRRDVERIFPGNFSYEASNQVFVVSREIFFDRGDSSSYGLPNNTIFTSLDTLNKQYTEFKKINNLDLIENYQYVIFKEGACFIEDKKCSIKSCDPFGEGIRFIINTNFELLLGKRAPHDYIWGGKYCLCAGLIKFDEFGKIIYMTNHTGHMQSSEYQLQTVLKKYRSFGILSSHMRLAKWTDLQSFLSLKDFLELNIEMPRISGKIIETSLERNELFNVNAEAYADLNHNDPVPFAAKILDVIAHKDYLIHQQMRLDFNPPNIIEKPFPEVYDKITEVYNHYVKEESLSSDHLPHHLIFGDLEVKEKAKKARQEELEILQENRPYQELWSELF